MCLSLKTGPSELEKKCSGNKVDWNNYVRLLSINMLLCMYTLHWIYCKIKTLNKKMIKFSAVIAPCAYQRLEHADSSNLKFFLLSPWKFFCCIRKIQIYLVRWQYSVFITPIISLMTILKLYADNNNIQDIDPATFHTVSNRNTT